MAFEDKESGKLIGSDKVGGTAVYGTGGEKIGSIEQVVFDMLSGRISYAVLAFGAFPGIALNRYPLSWNSLKYDGDLGGYQVDVTEDELKEAPRYLEGEEWDWSDPARGDAVDKYYETSGKAFGFVQNAAAGAPADHEARPDR